MNIGAHLRTSREAKGLSLDAVAHTTRVQLRILTAIERNDVRAVPPRPFGRGFVRAYAREIGLDPDQTARDYFEQFAPIGEPLATGTPLPDTREPMTSRRAWLWVAAAAVGVAFVVGLAPTISTPGDRAGRQSPDPIVGTSGTGDGGAASGTRPPSHPVENGGRLPVVAQPTHPLVVVLTPTGTCWVTASTDGQRVIHRLLLPGAVETLRADRDMTILVGDADAMTWTVNGRRVGTMGRSREVRTVRVTPETAASIR
jgi:cytoskeleton protein RodZ